MSPFILVGPTGAASACLEPLRVALGGECWERPGWGASRAEHGSYAHQGALLAATLRSRAQPVGLFGWSSGGFVALHAALRAPEWVTGVTVYEAPLGGSRDATARQRLRFLETVLLDGLGFTGRARGAFWRMVTERRDGTTGFDLLTPAAQWSLRGHLGPLVRELLMGTGEELLGSLGDLAVPLVVLVGADSAPTAERAAARLAGRAPTASIVTVAGADHLGPVTHPLDVARAIASR